MPLVGIRAQKADVYKRGTVVKAVRTHWKANQFAKADTELRNAWAKYPQAAADPQLYNMELNTLHQMSLLQNRNMYLGTNPDTVKYFDHIYNIYYYGMKCDSIESVPDERGRQNYRYRRNNADIMLRYRKNLHAAGRYFFSKKDFRKAATYVDLYLSTKTLPMYKAASKPYAESEADTTRMSTICVLSSYAVSDHRLAVKYLNTSLSVEADTTTKVQLHEIGSKSYAALGDTVSMLSSLRSGFSLSPRTEYFYLTLLNYYTAHNQPVDALTLTDSMLTVMPEHRDYWFVRASLCSQLDMPSDTILAAYARCIQLRPDDVDSYVATGKIYLQRAQKLYSAFNLTLTDPGYLKAKAAISAEYDHACRAFESVRALNESKTELWLAELRECYYRLNKGRELKGLERY